MGFSRQEYLGRGGGGLPCPPPGDLSRFFTTPATWKAICITTKQESTPDEMGRFQSGPRRPGQQVKSSWELAALDSRHCCGRVVVNTVIVSGIPSSPFPLCPPGALSSSGKEHGRSQVTKWTLTQYWPYARVVGLLQTTLCLPTSVLKRNPHCGGLWG